MNTVKIQQATENDSAAIARIHYRALEKYHIFYAAFFAKHPRDFIPLSTESALRNPKNRFLTAVDETTKQVVGFIQYQVIEETSSLPTKKSLPEPPTNPASSSQSLFRPKGHLV